MHAPLRHALVRDHDMPVQTRVLDMPGHGRVSGRFSCFESFSLPIAPAGAIVVLAGQKMDLQPGQVVRIFCTNVSRPDPGAATPPAADHAVRPPFYNRERRPEDRLDRHARTCRDFMMDYKAATRRVTILLQADEVTTIHGPALVEAGPVLAEGTFSAAARRIAPLRNRDVLGAVRTLGASLAAFSGMMACLAILAGGVFTSAFLISLAGAAAGYATFAGGRCIFRAILRQSARDLQGAGHIPRMITGKTNVKSLNFLPLAAIQEAPSASPVALLENTAQHEMRLDGTASPEAVAAMPLKAVNAP